MSAAIFSGPQSNRVGLSSQIQIQQYMANTKPLTPHNTPNPHPNPNKYVVQFEGDDL